MFDCSHSTPQRRFLEWHRIAFEVFLDHSLAFHGTYNMKASIGSFFKRQFDLAMDLNHRNILESLPHKRECNLLDLGCDDGTWTLELSQASNTDSVTGVEIVQERAETARARGVDVIIADLANPLPLPSAFFDIVHANQVIEHVPDIDLFAAEIFRVLRPGGIAIVSTENASSWHNVFSVALGWQMFSLTNLSDRRLGIGNPLALHRGEAEHLKTWTHKVIFSYRGLIEFFEAHQFIVQRVRGAGYHPLPAWIGKVDVRHAHFLTIQVEKPMP
jgi:SAM-dependent methyltransferase